MTALYTLLVFIAIGVMASLGVWQVRRHQERSDLNVQRERRLALPPLTLGAAPTPASAHEERAVAFGEFETAPTFTLLNRGYKGEPGVEIVSPLRLRNTGHVVLVNRGWIPLNSKHLAPAAPTGPVTVQGYLFEYVATGQNPHPPTLPPTTWVRLDPQGMAHILGEPVYPFALMSTAPIQGERFPIANTPPPIDAGPHWSYAIQWFSFAAIFLIGWFFWLRQKD